MTTNESGYGYVLTNIAFFEATILVSLVTRNDTSPHP